MNEKDIKKWIADNEHELFIDDTEEPKYIPSPIVEDFIEELMSKQSDEILEAKQKAIEAFKFATDGYFTVGGTDYSGNRLNEFIDKLNS